MVENISKRIGRIVSGGVNAMVAAAEEASPVIVMEQSLREIDLAIDEVKVEKGQATAARYLANKRLSQHNSKHSDIAGKIELAVEQNRDDLAEAAISQQIDIEAQIPVLENIVTDCCGQEAQFDGYLTALNAKKREMLDELNLYKKSLTKTPENGVSAVGEESQSYQKAQQSMAVFDKILGENTGVSSLNTEISEAAKLAELEQLSIKSNISQRLAKIKAERASK